METIQEYIIALTNLYGVVGKEEVLDIYNQQNDEQISINDIEIYYAEKSDKLAEHFVYTDSGFFVHQALSTTDTMMDMLEEQGGKPYYIPAKEELLKYAEEGYFEKTKEYLDLLDYIVTYLIDDLEDAEELCKDIHGMRQFGVSLQHMFDILTQKGIGFDDMEQTNEFLMKVSTLSNNIRIWENKGFTPNEIFEKYEKPNMRPLPDEPYYINQQKDIGRNDPCYCGSGKKYKKCCLGKDRK